MYRGIGGAAKVPFECALEFYKEINSDVKSFLFFFNC